MYVSGDAKPIEHILWRMITICCTRLWNICTIRCSHIIKILIINHCLNNETMGCPVSLMFFWIIASFPFATRFDACTQGIWVISHLKRYKSVRMRYLACTFNQMKSINMFPMFCNLELPDISFGDLLRFKYITSPLSCSCMSMLTSNFSGNMQKHGYLGCFHAASARENISLVWVILRPL